MTVQDTTFCKAEFEYRQVLSANVAIMRSSESSKDLPLLMIFRYDLVEGFSCLAEVLKRDHS